MIAVVVLATSTLQVSVFPLHVAVIIAVPAPFAETSPLLSTVATVSLLLLHATVSFLEAFVFNFFVSAVPCIL